MATEHDDLYGVYVRGVPEIGNLDRSEFRVVTCPSYGELRRIQRLLQPSVQECVIRFLGEVGGGD